MSTHSTNYFTPLADLLSDTDEFASDESDTDSCKMDNFVQYVNNIKNEIIERAHVKGKIPNIAILPKHVYTREIKNILQILQDNDEFIQPATNLFILGHCKCNYYFNEGCGCIFEYNQTPSCYDVINSSKDECIQEINFKGSVDVASFISNDVTSYKFGVLEIPDDFSIPIRENYWLVAKLLAIATCILWSKKTRHDGRFIRKFSRIDTSILVRIDALPSVKESADEMWTLLNEMADTCREIYLKYSNLYPGSEFGDRFYIFFKENSNFAEYEEQVKHLRKKLDDACIDSLHVMLGYPNLYNNVKSASKC